VGFHSLWKFVLSHLGASLALKYFDKAGPRALHLIPGMFILVMTVFGRAMQMSNDRPLLTVVMECLLVFAELSDARGMLKGRTFIEWIVEVITRPEHGVALARQDRGLGDGSTELRMDPRRKRLFGNLISFQAMIEGASLPMVAAFYIIVSTNPGEAAGTPIRNETIIINTLVMLFFEVVVADYAVAKMSEHYQRKDPNCFIDVEVVYARRKKSTNMVGGYMLVTAAYAWTQGARSSSETSSASRQ